MNAPRIGEERRHEYEGDVFIIRDVWVKDARRPSGERLMRCEYKTRVDGKIVWKPCYEGVLFSDIEPFEKAA